MCKQINSLKSVKLYIEDYTVALPIMPLLIFVVIDEGIYIVYLSLRYDSNNLNTRLFKKHAVFTKTIQKYLVRQFFVINNFYVSLYLVHGFISGKSEEKGFFSSFVSEIQGETRNILLFSGSHCIFFALVREKNNSP